MKNQNPSRFFATASVLLGGEVALSGSGKSFTFRGGKTEVQTPIAGIFPEVQVTEQVNPDTGKTEKVATPTGRFIEVQGGAKATLTIYVPENQVVIHDRDPREGHPRLGAAAPVAPAGEAAPMVGSGQANLDRLVKQAEKTAGNGRPRQTARR